MRIDDHKNLLSNNTLSQLFSEWVDDGFRPDELDWGIPVGRELKW